MSNETTEPNRVKIGAPAGDGGQYATKDVTEAVGVALDEADDDACECGESLDDGEGYDGKCGSCADGAESSTEITAKMDETVDLVFVEYDDKLTDEQVNMVLAGRWSEVEDAVESVFAESRENNLIEECEKAAAAAGYDWDELSETVQETVRYEVERRDGSDPVADLLRQTPKQLLRTCLGQPGPLAGAAWQEDFGNDEAIAIRHEAVAGILRGAGLNTATPEATSAIAELVSESGGMWHEGVDLDVLWYGDVATASSSPSSEHSGSNTLTFTNPTILLIDRINGSGHEVRILGQVRKNLAPNLDQEDLERTEKVYLDSAAGGYGWDSIAGVVKSAYESPVDSTWA